MNATIHVSTPGALDDYGNAAPSAPVPLPARVQAASETVRGAGEAQMPRHVLFTVQAVSDDATIWLPGENTADPNAGRKVKRAGFSESPSGVRLYRIEL